MRGIVVIFALLLIVLLLLLLSKLPRNFIPRRYYGTEEGGLSAKELQRAKAEAKQLYSQRMARVKEVCKVTQISEHFSSLWYAPRERLLFCEVKKVASSTWKAHFKKLYPEHFQNRTHGDREEIRRAFFDVPTKVSKEELEEDAFSLAFVRHPISRLHSAYRQQMVRPTWNNTLPFQRHLRDWVIMSTRNIIDPLSDNHTNPEPEESIGFLLDRKRKWKQETGSGEMDDHFRPQWHSCDFCNRKWDALGKLETFDEDFWFVARALKLENKLDYRHSNQGSRKGFSDSVGQFWSKLSEETKSRVFKFYEEDFEAFGYSREIPLTEE